MPVATAEFEVTNWDAKPWDEPTDGPMLARVTMNKTFTGDLEGASAAELVSAQGEGGEAYSAIDKFEGTINGLPGSFVMHHGGHRAPDAEAVGFGQIVRGSGTGELAGITGTAEFRHDETGARLTVDYELE